jgi:3-hydroxy-9,10-secoandrosta-1,3,5(10)-triene-9,17-dione monooxygenase
MTTPATQPTHADLVARAHALVPVLRERAPRAEELRRIPDDTINDLHASGLFRMLQPRRVGGSELSYEAIVELTAIIGRVRPHGYWPTSPTITGCWPYGRVMRKTKSGGPHLILLLRMRWSARR